MASQQEGLARLFEVGYTDETHPVLILANQLASPISLINYTLTEVKEWGVEQKNLDSAKESQKKKLPPSKELLLEFADFIVMLRILNKKLGIGFSVEDTIFSKVNGQFHGDFSQLKEQTANLAEGNILNNFESLFTILFSFVKQLGPDFQGEFLARLVEAKLFANREPRFFQLEPNMTEEDVLSKNNHTFEALSIIRGFLKNAVGYEVALQAWITDFFAEEILDWRNSRQALQKLRTKLLSFKQQVGNEVIWNMTGGLNQDSPLLQLKLAIAGGVELGSAKSQAVLQNNTANATLERGTVFWV